MSIKTKFKPLGYTEPTLTPTYYAWTNGSKTVYTQCATPNETYGEYVFTAPNEIGSAITAHTDSTVTAGGVTYTRNEGADDTTPVTSFYYEVDTTEYSIAYNKGQVPFASGTYTSLVGETITIDWGDDTNTVVTDGVFSSSNTVHTYSSNGTYTIKITTTSNLPQCSFYVSPMIFLLTKIKSVLPKTVGTTGTGVSSVSDFFNNTLIKTLPQGFLQYNKSITTVKRFFYHCVNLINVPEDVFSYDIGITDLSSCFGSCTSLVSIPENIFKNNTAATTVYEAFYRCTSLTSIPSGLFDNNTKITTIGYCFSTCTSLASIPSGLFDNNTKITDMSSSFRGCTSLTSIPEYLFRYNTAVSRFDRCFNECTNLQLNANIFCDEATEMTTRFAKLASYNAPSFISTFEISSFSGTQGTAPQLWNYTYKSTPTSTSCFTGHTASSVTNFSDIPTSWGGPTKLYAWGSGDNTTSGIYNTIYTLDEDPTDSDITVYDSSGTAIDKSSWYIPAFVGMSTVGSVVRSGSSLIAKSSDELSQLSYPRNSAKDTYY